MKNRFFALSIWIGKHELTVSTPIRRHRKRRLNSLHKVHDFYSKYLDWQAHANSEDPDQTSTEYDISSKNRQLRAISVDPGKTPTVYPICSKGRVRCIS